MRQTLQVDHPKMHHQKQKHLSQPTIHQSMRVTSQGNKMHQEREAVTSRDK